MVQKTSLIALAGLACAFAAGCGDDATREVADAKARPAKVDVESFLMRKDEEPGFRQGARPDQMPRSRGTITGVNAFVKDANLGPADAQRLRGDGFISTTFQPIRGPRTAGVSNVTLFATAKGAAHHMAHELRTDVLRTFLPRGTTLRRFTVPGIPGARGWTASMSGEPAGHDVGNVHWVQGRCMLVLGNQGPGPFVGPLSTGARAIYERTNGVCPS